MKLLFRSGVAVLAVVAGLTIVGLAPLLAMLYVGTGRRAVLELARTAALIFAIVILWAGVALTAETWRSLARLRLVIC